MEVVSTNGVKVYNVSVGKAVPQWLQEKKQKAKAYLRGPDKVQLELIQDFAFPTTATKIKQTSDGRHVLATGVYPPMIKAYSTDDLSLKFKRHLDADVVTFELLTDDFTKMVMLRSDRTFEFHGKSETYYKTRMPIFGRDMAYHWPTCDMFAVGSSNLIYRLNLEQGRFLKPLSGSSPAINVCTINPASGILATGGNDSILECWDPRDRSHLASLKILNENERFMFSSIEHQSFVGQPASGPMLSSTSPTTGITCLRFSTDGLTLATGMASGHVLLYDLRKNVPFIEKDHQFDSPIVDINFHDYSRQVISSCKKIIKVWDKDDGKAFCNIEPTFDINTVHVVPSSGILMVGGENPRMNIYYVPELGPAPKWASFLDNITEELEADTKQSVYQDYKFITREELERLGVTKLIGTPYLRAYMHGFFIDFRLYKKIRDIARPDEYREYLKERVKEQMEKKRGSRISAQPVMKIGTKVNQDYLNNIEGRKGSVAVTKVIADDRFSRMFQDPNMAVDVTSESFQRAHPTNPTKSKFSDQLSTEFKEVKNRAGYESDEVEDEKQVDALGFDDEDRAPIGEGKQSKKRKRQDEPKDSIASRPSQALNSNHKNQSSTTNQTNQSSTASTTNPNNRHQNRFSESHAIDAPPMKKVRLLEAQQDSDSPFQKVEEKKRKQNVSFGTRLSSEEGKALSTTTDSVISTMGPLQMTFVPEAKKKEKRDFYQARNERRERNKGRRSMKSVHKLK